MIARVYGEQCSILDALADFQFYDALFREGLTDEVGNAKRRKKQRNGPDQEDNNEESDKSRGDNLSTDTEPVADSLVPLSALLLAGFGGIAFYGRVRELFAKLNNSGDRKKKKKKEKPKKREDEMAVVNL